MEDCLSETGHSLTENQIDAVVQDIQENFEENFETCTKEIVKRAQDFKANPRNHYNNPPPNHHFTTVKFAMIPCQILLHQQL